MLFEAIAESRLPLGEIPNRVRPWQEIKPFGEILHNPRGNTKLDCVISRLFAEIKVKQSAMIIPLDDRLPNILEIIQYCGFKRLSQSTPCVTFRQTSGIKYVTTQYCGFTGQNDRNVRIPTENAVFRAIEKFPHW